MFPHAHTVCVTLQWEDVDVEFLQQAKGTDEVQLLLNLRRTVWDQLQTRPDGTTANRTTDECGKPVNRDQSNRFNQ